MKRICDLPALIILLVSFCSPSYGQSWWTETTERTASQVQGKRWIQPRHSRLIAIDLKEVKKQLAEAPLWFTEEAKRAPIELTIPMPDGTNRIFQVVEAPVMSEGLAAKFPGMRSFAGTSREDGTAYARFGFTHKGFHAMISSAKHSTVFIDRYAEGQNRFHQVYFKKDYDGIPGNEFVCMVDESHQHEEVGRNLLNNPPKWTTDCQLRSYRLALSCTGEYGLFQGGTVPDVMAEFNIAITRVNGILKGILTCVWKWLMILIN